MRTIVIGLTLLFSGAPAVTAAVPSPRSTASGLAASDVFRLRTLGIVAISPDGTLAAYVMREPDVMTDGYRASVHVVDVRSGAERRVLPGADQPSWSRDGARLAWISTAGVEPKLMVGGPDGGGPRVVSGSADGFGGIAWSPSGREIAFTRFVADREPAFVYPVEKPAGAVWAAAPVVRTGIDIQRDGAAAFHPGHEQLYTASLVDGAVRVLTHGEADASNPSWTPDGEGIYYFTEGGGELERSYLTSRMQRISVATGIVSTISTPGLAPRAVAPSPDGRQLAFVASATTGRDYEPSGLYLVDVAGGPARRLDAGLDREIGDPRFSADGRAVLATYADDGAMRLARFGKDGGREVLLTRFDGEYAVSDRGSVAFALPGASRPAELAVREADGRTRLLSDLNREALKDRRLASKRVLDVRSSLDGVRVGA